ncbi:hypothetical protein [Kutzneria sp. 744]|uniref:hypothetical protein n=1 Tax=Kutzneria sp. (strain 744) TaxID=345341 RepID=UPI0003EEB8EF|nr:hypothetical protein [Kutzneria sp. 744]EWM15059.1 LigA protein [Kutzneria sp. 744]
MSKSDDPERLLAEALRAQAVSTPVTMPPLPAVLTKAADPAPEQPETAASDEAAADEAPDDTAVEDESPEQDAAAPAQPVVPEQPVDSEPSDSESGDSELSDSKLGDEASAAAVAEPKANPKPPAGSGDGAFTEEMVLRELSSGPMTGELATIRINNSQHQYETERFSPLENLYGPVGAGPGFGLISGSEVGSTVGPPVGEFDHLLPELPTRATATNAVPTTRMRTERGQVPGWLILLFALVLGLAGGAVAGLLSML